MKAVIVYDSVYGNTELVAKSIAKALEAAGHTPRLVHVRDAKGGVEGDILMMGSPTRIGTMTGRMKRFLKRMDGGTWGGKPVAAFDTEMQGMIEKDGASAAAKMHDLARKKGVRVHTPVLKVGVSEIRGPLSPGWEAGVEAYVKEFLAAAGSWG